MKMSNVERLVEYYPFSDHVLGMVEGAIERQSGLSFRQLADRYDIADGPEPIRVSPKPIEILRFKPKQDYDERHARILHTQYAIPVWSMATHAMRLFEADPSTQLIMVGNAAAIGNRYNRLSAADVLKVWRGDLKPIVRPHLEYLASIGVTSVDQIGFSWGADKAAEASGPEAREYGIGVSKGVYIEPVSVVNRSAWRLLQDFRSAEPELNRYMQASDMPAIDDRSKSALGETMEFLRYVGGMARLSNWAIDHVLSQKSFSSRAIKVLNGHPDQKTTITIAWGSHSELVPGPAIMDEISIIHKVSQDNAKRVGTILLRGMHHAGGDDIDLHAAIVLQGLHSN